jgi:hypothetical protein
MFNVYRGKQLGLETEDSSPYNAKVKNKWRCPSAPPPTAYASIRCTYIVNILTISVNAI